MIKTDTKKIVIKILSDAIIFQRLTDRMQEALAVFNPQKGIESHFLPALNYNGYNTALDLIGLTDLEKYAELRDQLQEIAIKQAESFKIGGLERDRFMRSSPQKSRSRECMWSR